MTGPPVSCRFGRSSIGAHTGRDQTCIGVRPVKALALLLALLAGLPAMSALGPNRVITLRDILVA